MLGFLLRRFAVKGAQRVVDGLEPEVLIHVPEDLPLPSIGTVRRMARAVARINGLEPGLQRLSDEDLRRKTAEFKERYGKAVAEKRGELVEAQRLLAEAGQPEEREELSQRYAAVRAELKKVKQAALDEILPEAFAAVREASRRFTGLRHYDIQLVGGMVLHEGRIAEMATGEGKTLVAPLPVYLNALAGEGVHLVTVNDYLAKRDREWMGPIYESLGLSVGVIIHDLDPEARKAAYACDITYGTNNEFGFDYLRDNMVNFKEEMVQRGHHYAIVDEVDSILIDEARTPLIISGPAEESTDTYYTANTLARQLKGRRVTEQEEVDAKYRSIDLGAGYDYVADEKARSVALTEQGEEKASRGFGIQNLHDLDALEFRHHILQALKAKEFFRRDVDYVVRDGEVIIVDEFTGRLMPGRRWSDGLHQAVEAKEGIKIERENQTLATITFQNYFRMYEKLAGMTGTAYTEANEFKQIYNLDCVVLPTNRPLRRINNTDCIYKSVREKYAAVVNEIAELYQRGQPVLVGTISIEKSEILSALLKQRGIPHQVLNAKYHELEAQIVAQAGRYKAVTIATNMAGRGTDIVLGGNAEFLARNLAREKFKEGTDPAEQEAMIKKFLEEFRAQCKKEHDQVVAVGGLHVLGTERHEARRIDNQLRGRSGRQGDPGSSRFYVSLEDDLMRLFASDRIMAIMERLGMEEGQVIEHNLVSRALEVAQKRVETQNFEFRKQLLEYDNVMNKQREAIYGLRSHILESASVKDRVGEAIREIIALVVEERLFAVKEEVTWDVEGFALYLQTGFLYDLAAEKEALKDKTKEEIIELVTDGVLAAYEQKEKEVGAERLRQMERILLLNIIDGKWKDHLYAMDQLKGGISLRSYGQRDPLIEFKREGFAMFEAMFQSINQEVAEMVFAIRPLPQEVRYRGVFSSRGQQFVHPDVSGFSQTPDGPVGRGHPGPQTGGREDEPPEIKTYHRPGPKVGRNAPCPCGSGKKYKRCCGR